MNDLTLTLIGLLLFAFGGFIGHFLTRRHYSRLLTADKKAKILSEDEKEAMRNSGLIMVKLDFPSLLKDMELKHKLWIGSKHAKIVGGWINWIKSILDKSGNTFK